VKRERKKTDFFKPKIELTGFPEPSPVRAGSEHFSTGSTDYRFFASSRTGVVTYSRSNRPVRSGFNNIGSLIMFNIKKVTNTIYEPIIIFYLNKYTDTHLNKMYTEEFN
jgi:hypothetical protein